MIICMLRSRFTQHLCSRLCSEEVLYRPDSKLTPSSTLARRKKPKLSLSTTLRLWGMLPSPDLLSTTMSCTHPPSSLPASTSHSLQKKRPQHHPCHALLEHPWPWWLWLSFYKATWHIVNPALMCVLRAFHTSNLNLDNINRSYITLLTKKLYVLAVGDLRPICL